MARDEDFVYHLSQALCPEMVASHHRHVPRAPLPKTRRYLVWHDVLPHVRGHCPSFIAHTGSCVRPKPSRRLRFNYYDRSLQVVASLCWPPARRAYGSERRWPFPTLSLQSLPRCLDPYPAMFPWCTCSLLPRRQRPHLRRHRFGTPNTPCNATSTG